LDEGADVEDRGDGVSEGEELAGGGASAGAVRAVGGPVEEREAGGGVGEQDEEADLAFWQGGECRARVVGVDGDAQGVRVEARVVQRDGAVGEDGDGVVGVAGVGGGGGGAVDEGRGVGEDVRAGEAADPQQLGGEGVEAGGVASGALAGRGALRGERSRKYGRPWQWRPSASASAVMPAKEIEPWSGRCVL